jgi:hypothetical protein
VAWVALAGTWGITSNKAYTPGSVSAENVAVVNCGSADGTIQATVTLTSGLVGEAGLAARFSNGTNGWLAYGGAAATPVNKWSLAKKVAGAYTFFTPLIQVTPANGDVLKISMAGPNLALRVNGVLVASVTDPFNQSVAQHGLRVNPGNGVYALDNFSFTP